MQKENIQTIDPETGEVLNQAKEKYSLDYVLEQIEAIRVNDQYLKESIASLGMMTSGGPGDVGMASKAEAIKDAVVAREQTNRRLLDIYEKMYVDLKPTKQEMPDDVLKLQQLADILCRMNPKAAANIMETVVEQMF